VDSYEIKLTKNTAKSGKKEGFEGKNRFFKKGKKE